MRQNASGCLSNMFYQPLIQAATASPLTIESIEAWKVFVRQKEHFSCAQKPDGFYASRWCNVFYRCFMGLKYEFLCAKQQNGDRLWWTQHGQQNAQETAECAWPCDIKRQCMSPGGILIDQGNSIVSESSADINRILESCDNQIKDFFRLPSSSSSQQDNCLGMPDGSFQSDSQYCNVFHVCFGGKRKDFLCAKASNGLYDLWWNDVTKSCDWPCKISCNKQIFGSANSALDIFTADKNLNGDACFY